MINSMTAFARCKDQGKWGAITWEIRSVNHRFLDGSFRLPESLRNLELNLRELLRSNISRGRVECFLRYQPGDAAELQLSLNTNLVQQLSKAVQKVNQQLKEPTSAINPLHLLSWNNVLQISETEATFVNNKVMKLFEQTVKELVKVRKQEGAALKKILLQRLQSITAEIAKIKKLLPAIMQQQRTKLLTRLNEIKAEVEPSRLEQELVYLAQKADVAEELDRLTIHVQEVKRVLNSNGAMGKRLDFLMQELNREANTLSSKSADNKTTHAAVELKVLIEEMREQVQNIE
ncbi:MAG: YicC family protein [Gammaproteobacteria bacterium]|nr:YicC family protein [Gammaproteobacteria bacterium]